MPRFFLNSIDPDSRFLILTGENAAHANELPMVHYTVIRAALAQMGVGGDDSWGARVHDEYLLPKDKRLKFTFCFKGI